MGTMGKGKFAKQQPASFFASLYVHSGGGSGTHQSHIHNKMKKKKVQQSTSFCSFLCGAVASTLATANIKVATRGQQKAKSDKSIGCLLW